MIVRTSKKPVSLLSLHVYHDLYSKGDIGKSLNVKISEYIPLKTIVNDILYDISLIEIIDSR